MHARRLHRRDFAKSLGGVVGAALGGVSRPAAARMTFNLPPRSYTVAHLEIRA